MPTPSIQTLRTDAQQVLNLDSISAVRSVVAATLANANAGTPLNPNLTTQQLWNEFYQIVTQPKSDIESIIANQLMKFLYAPPAPGGVGADGQVIFNDGGVLAGDPGLTFDKVTNALTITGAATVNGAANLNGAVNLSTAGTATVLLGSSATYGVLAGSGTNAASIYINGATRPGNAAMLQFGAAEHQFLNSSLSSLWATLNSTGLNIANGNVILGTSGKGIDFSATSEGSGTMTSELLNDYEEGTWTGTLKGSVSDPTTPVTATGRYTKIGRQVTVQVIFSGVNTTGASGRIGVDGLPFANASTVETIASVGFYDIATFTGSPFGQLGQSQTRLELYSSVSNSIWGTVTHNAGGTKYMWVNLTYTVS
jgi:hypothetical protein